MTAPVHLRRPRIETHRGRLAVADRTVHRGIPVTSVARTLVDLGHLLDDESLERVVREAQFRGLWNETAIRDALSRRSSPRVRAYLGDIAPTQTTLEDRFLRLCDRHGIPRPLTQRGTDLGWTSSGRRIASWSRSMAGSPTARGSPSSRTAR